MKKLLMCISLVLFGVAVWADDPITGGEWEVAGDYTIIKSGECRLVGQTTTTHISILAGAKLVLDTDGLFTIKPVFHIDGTLDLNGHSCSILRLVNLTTDDYPRAFTARIVNGGAADVLIYMDNSSTTEFYGKIEETNGKIALRGPNGTFNLLGPDGAMAISCVSNTSSSTLLPYVCPTRMRIVLYPSLAGEFDLRLAEIGFTYKGTPVPIDAVKLVQGGDVKTYNHTELFDGEATTGWNSASPNASTLEISFANGYIPRIDGYRLTPYDENDNTCYRPGGWDIYTFRSATVGWVLADSVRNFNGWSSQVNSSTTNMLFSAEGRLGSVFGEQTDLTLNSTAENALRVSTVDPLKTGAIKGAGTIRIENGSTLQPGSLADYTGKFTVNACTTPETQAKLAISSRGGVEQPVTISSQQNLAVINGGAEPVSVLLDDSRTEHLFGRLADGENGALGLVKRGSGERVLETEDSSYTGPTKVEAGTLTVSRTRTTIGTVTARYLRFTPLTTVGSDASYPWAANELQLLDANGDVIAWPTGTTADKPANTGSEHSGSKIKRFVDGDTTTRMLMPKFSDASTGYAAITVTMPSDVTFAGYRWVSTRDNEVDKRRTPLTWKLEISSDNSHWQVCDVGEQAWSSEEESASWEAGKEGFPRTVAAVRGSATMPGTGLCTLSEEFLKAGTSRSTHGTIEARYFRFCVLDIADTTASQHAWGWQLAEIGLMKDGQRVDWPANLDPSIKGSSVNRFNNSNRSNLVNNVIWEAGKGEVSATRESAFVEKYPSTVTIDAGKKMSFDSYSLVGLKTYWYRMPSAWTFEISNDGTTWTRIDAKGGYVISEEQRSTGDGYPEMGPFPVAAKYPLLDRGAGDSLGDASSVSIAAGATLKLATDYEKFGALSGAGTLDLEWNAVGEINATEAATFSGTVAGSGTLVLGGGVQTFDNADLSGVKVLEFAGGAIGGTATVNGTLDVTGDVRIAVPSLGDSSRVTQTILSATALTPAAQEAFRNATFVLPEGVKEQWVSIAVSETAVTVTVAKPGLILIFR